MEDRAPGPRAVPIKGSAEDRLQSWKEIAAYLGRDVRSVYRWEKTEHLPIHRLQHGKQGSVYAFRSELDAWVAARSAGPRPKERRRRWILWVTAGAILVAAGAGLTVLWLGAPPQPPVPLPFASGPGLQSQPSLSPDAQQVAFAWNGENRRDFDIYVALGTGAPAFQLTHDRADEYSPAWSPDAASIAFLRRRDAERVAVVIAPALGGAERVLIELASGARLEWSRPGPFLTWSRDGKWLIMSGWEKPKSTDRLLRISAATGETLPLTAPPAGSFGDFAPALSPDGTILAFIRRLSWGVSQLCVMPVGRDLASDGEVRVLDTGSAWNASPAWWPGGQRLIFSTGSMDSPYLASMAVSGRGKATRLAGFGDYGWQPSLALSREGKVRLVYAHHFESVNVWRQPLDRAGPASEVIASAHRSYEPDYSPDGSRVAFLSDRTGYVEVWVAAADGGSPRQWTFLKQASLGAPRWSPDGRRIAFTMPGPKGSSIYWIDSPGAGPRLVPDSAPSGYVAWAPDGQSIYFSTTRGNATNIWKAGLHRGGAVQVTVHSPSRVPAVSLEGKSLLFLRLVGTNGENDLYRMPLAGSAEEKLLPFVDAYSACRDGVAYKYYRPGPNPEGPRLRFYRFATGESLELGETAKPLRYGIDLSPDCRYLLYSQADYEVSDLMLVDNVR